MKQKNGITLIALVITVIVLLILAGISIIAISGENGVLTKSIQAKETHKVAELEEKLKLIATEEQVKNNGSIDLESYIQNLKEKNLPEVNSIEKQADGSYQIYMENKYMFEIKQVGNSIQISYMGKNDEEPPKIVGVQTSKTTNSISVTVEAEGTANSKYTYYIKENDQEDFQKVKENTSNQYTFENLKQNTIYNIKVIITNKFGIQAEKTVNETTGELPTGKIQFGEVQWQSGTASVSISTTESYSIQWQKNGKDGKWEIGNEVTGLKVGDIVYARLWDGTNGSSDSSIQITDGIKPTSPTFTITSGTVGNNNWYKSNVVVEITNGQDQESGVEKTVYKIEGAQTQGETTGNSITINSEGISTITAYTYDNAGNISEASTISIQKDTVGPVFAGLNNTTVTSYTDTTFTEGITISDQTSGVASATAFTYDPTVLTNGENTITYTATDNAGNITPQTRIIRYNPVVCFVAGTKVSTPQGLINIEKLKIGDIVYTYNENTKEVEEKEIEKTFINKAQEIVKMEFETGEEIKNTTAHPYYVVGEGWKETKDLKVGDYILTQENKKIKITKMTKTRKPNTKVYNLSIKDNHNYFVGNTKLLVHNITAPDTNGGTCGLEEYPIY